MVEFCPECGNLLRKNSCKCGYNLKEKRPKVRFRGHIWDPPSPNTIYCRLMATSYKKLKSKLKKGIFPEELKEIKKNLKNHLYNCQVCLYYDDKMSRCKKRNKFLQKNSICRNFEPYKA